MKGFLTPNHFLYLVFLFIWGSLVSCKQENRSTQNTSVGTQIHGKTMGTTYTIKCQSTNLKPLQSSIDSMLFAINMGTSTYMEESIISKFNARGNHFIINLIAPYHDHFWNNLKASKDIYTFSNGLFDPSCMPLVNYWGFGYTEKKAVTKVDSHKVNQILTYVGFDKLDINKPDENTIRLTKSSANFALDFSAIAKGYAVDVISTFLEEKMIVNYMVEIGGEVKVKGLNNKNTPWSIGINKPISSAQQTDIEWIIHPKNQGMASSGNYRNYYETNGETYGHAINPLTGYPEQTDVLSSSVTHPSCMLADALATASMIMGKDAFLEATNRQNVFEACIIYLEQDTLQTVFSKGFEEFVQ